MDNSLSQKTRIAKLQNKKACNSRNGSFTIAEILDIFGISYALHPF
jgi:hypothetical protein